MVKDKFGVHFNVNVPGEQQQYKHTDFKNKQGSIFKINPQNAPLFLLINGIFIEQASSQ
jgi:hypothetical protein